MPNEISQSSHAASALSVGPGREGDGPIPPSTSPPPGRWGVILAGGDGTRLQPLTRLISGDDRPKQFCPIVSRDTLLEQTRRRARRTIPDHHLLFYLSRHHEPFYRQEARLRPSQRVVQPSNKGTAPPILHSLLSIARLDRNALVAILPCDHHYADDNAFITALESAFEVAERRRDAIVLLGAHPQGPEVEYGWIELAAGDDLAKPLLVKRFLEKPSPQVACQLMNHGALWNTFVMVGHVGAFLEMIGAALPELMEMFPAGTLWTGSELHIPEFLYQRLNTTDFSRCVLSAAARNSRLIALPLRHAGWSDLGHPDRVLAVLEARGLTPWWKEKWEASRRQPKALAALAGASTV